MITTHSAHGNTLRKQTSNPVMGLLANKRGGFTLISDSPYTRYGGVHFMEGEQVYKVIEEIRPAASETVEICNSLSTVERKSANCTERFWSNHSNTLMYEVDRFKGYIDLILDCRKIYDFDDKGRFYSVSRENGDIVVNYRKERDGGLDYGIVLIIKGAKEYSTIGAWEERHYPYEKERGSKPYSVWVYRALRLKVDGPTKLVFSYALDKGKAALAAEHTVQNYDFLKKSKDSYIRSITSVGFATDPETTMAYRCAVSSLDSLMTEQGIFAGYPWFTQVWTRDEALSLKAILLEEGFEDAKKFLLGKISQIDNDGRIPNRYPAVMLASADGVGLVWKRVHDLIDVLKHRGILHQYLTNEDLLFIKEQLKKSIKRLLEGHTLHGLEYTGPLETWMDTYYRDDTRSGARIEIQALRLQMYNLMTILCHMTGNDPAFETYSELEEVTKQRVREAFWKSPVLCDGESDPTVRPNIFLAHYFYPHLLSRKEWSACFDHALQRLWLDWGGLATIDRQHTLFLAQYTGEDNRSYHRGDSWYFVNNMAALCMHRVDPKRFKKQIDAILKASTSEILWSGAIGCHAELSSAKALESKGCFSQAWSAALFIELVDELCRK
jgi:hypothetical protein